MWKNCPYIVLCVCIVLFLCKHDVASNWISVNKYFQKKNISFCQQKQHELFFNTKLSLLDLLSQTIVNSSSRIVFLLWHLLLHVLVRILILHTDLFTTHCIAFLWFCFFTILLTINKLVFFRNHLSVFFLSVIVLFSKKDKMAIDDDYDINFSSTKLTLVYLNHQV